MESDVTDPNGDPVDDIVVVGQRRAPKSNDPFPVRGETGDIPVEVPDMGDPDYEPQPVADDCQDPEKRLEWDTDAAAARALAIFQQNAGNPYLDNRERCMILVRNPITGEVTPENLRVGDPGAGTCSFDVTGFGWENVVGLMHSHPGSGPYPSTADRDAYFRPGNGWQAQITAAGGPSSGLRLYMAGVAPDGPGGTNARFKLLVYNQINIDRGANEVVGQQRHQGPEVNPDGVPCNQG